MKGKGAPLFQLGLKKPTGSFHLRAKRERTGAAGENSLCFGGEFWVVPFRIRW